MKKPFLSSLCMLAAMLLFAQKEKDQNPAYQISRTRYMNLRDSLLTTQATTVQNTYEAYDWMAIRQERKDIRFLNRQQRRLNRSQNIGYPFSNSRFDHYPGYSGRSYNPYRNGDYYQGRYNNGFYNGGYINNGYYRNRYGAGNFYYNRYRPNFWWSFLF